jgi:hypothetical protein
VEIENNIIQLLQVETEQQLQLQQVETEKQLQGVGGCWLHDENFVGLFNLRGTAWATPGSFFGDCLAAREGNVEAIVRLAFGALRVGPADPEAKVALGRVGAAMERRPQLTEELTNLQQLADRNTLDNILDQILPRAIWSAIKSLDKSDRARVEKDGTDFYHPARPDPPPPDNSKSKLYFTPNEWTIHDLERLRSLLQAHVRNFVEEAIIGYAEVLEYGRWRGRQPDCARGPDVEYEPQIIGEKPKPEEKPSPEQNVFRPDRPPSPASIDDDADIFDDAAADTVKAETSALIRVRVDRAIASLPADKQPIARDLCGGFSPEAITAERGCSAATVSRVKADLLDLFAKDDILQAIFS